MKKLMDCFRKIKMKYCGISVILTLMFVCLVQEKVSAAEMLYKPYDSARWNGEYVKYNPESYERYDKNYSDTAIELYDGFTMELNDRNGEGFYYVAPEDVDITIWASDPTEYFSYYFRAYCSNGYECCANQASDEEPGLNILLKKGEKIYITTSNYNWVYEGTYQFHCTIKKTQSIKNITVVSQMEEGHVQNVEEFDPKVFGTYVVVEVLYADGRTQKMQAGGDYSWTIDAPPATNEPGKYDYTIYYRGYAIPLSYELKSYTDEMTLTSVTTNMNVDVPYNNGEYVGYSFVPQKSGLYNIFFDQWRNSPYSKVRIYEKEGRIISTWLGDNTQCFLLGGVEYQIYISKYDEDNTISFWIEDCLEYIEEGLEILPVERQWYTGKAICPKPILKYNGVDVAELGTVQYTYTRNKKMGMAAVIVDYKFNDKQKKHEGTLTVPFAIRSSMEQAQIELSAYTYSYTGQAITPEEKVIVGGKELVRGQDYTVAFDNNINAGVATVRVEGMGNYEGTATKTFTIEKIQQEISAQDTFTTYKGAKSFLLGAKATGALSYTSDNTKVAVINSNGKVSAKGYGVVNITINASETDNYLPASKVVSVIVTSKPSKILSVKSKARKKMTVKLQKAAGAQGYEISYSKDKNFKTGIVSKHIQKRTATFKKLKRKKTYYVRVRSYRKINGEKYYSAYSPARKVVIK